MRFTTKLKRLLKEHGIIARATTEYGAGVKAIRILILDGDTKTAMKLVKPYEGLEADYIIFD